MDKVAGTIHGFNEVEVFQLAEIGDYVTGIPSEDNKPIDLYAVAVDHMEPTTLNRYVKLFFIGNKQECMDFYNEMPDSVDMAGRGPWLPEVEMPEGLMFYKSVKIEKTKNKEANKNEVQ